MAVSLPVAADPVIGPLETVVNGVNGYLDQDLRNATLKALNISSVTCRNSAKSRTWEKYTRQFVDNLIVQSAFPN